MLRHRTWLILSVALLVGTTTVCAQERPITVPLQNPVLVPAQTTASTEIGHSPRKALLLSLLPGAGQIYNKQSWKVPIVYGGFALTGLFMYSNYNQMVKFRDEYLLRVNGGTPQLEGYTNYPNNSIYNYYQSYNQSFQLNIILSVAIYALNLVDAYVYGHLYEFQINDDISMSLQPALQTWDNSTFTTPVLSCTLSF